MRLIFFIFIFSCSYVYPQTSESKNPAEIKYRFSHLGISDGLAPGTVNCFYKDSKGFLWIGTSSGLNRFNGYNIDVFNPDPKDSLEIQAKDYSNIFEGPLGNMWVQTAGGMNIFDPKTESFSSSQFALLKQLGLPQKEVTEMYRDSGGNYWFSQNGAGISRYSPQTREVVRITTSPDQGSLSSNDVSWFAEDSFGNFWVIHTNGIFEKLDGKTLRITYRNTELHKKFDGDLYNYRLIVDNDNDLWIHLYEDFGIFFYDQESEAIRNFTKNTSEITLSSNLIRDVVRDLAGNIWIGTDHGGITVINTKTFEADYIFTNPEINNSLSHNSLTSLYADPDGIIWAGTFKNGVDYFHEGIIKFPHHEKLLSNPESLPFNDINVFAEDDAGNIWLGTNGGGLVHLNRKTWKYRQYLHDPKDPKSISSDVVVSLLFDSTGNLWVGTFLGGLNKFNGKEFKHYNPNPLDSTSVGGTSIWELFEDSRGNIWIGTLQEGIDVFDPKTEIFLNSREEKGIYPVHCNYITSITEDGDGNIWIGGVNGIDVINPATGESRHYYNDPKNPSSLNSNHVLSILCDSDNRIWIGTHGGLNLFNPENGTFFEYTEADGLPGNKILSVIEDDYKNLWLTTSFGLVKFRKNDINSEGIIEPNFQSYDEEDGLQGNLFNENSLYKTRSGDLLAGGLNGFNLFNPDNFQFNTKAPNVVFTSFELFNEKVKPLQKINGRILLQNSISQTSSITLEHDENLFSIEFAALDFIQPLKNRYRYKLEGFDQEWQEVDGTNRRVTYTNLDPGNYEFKVQASNNDQVWNTTGTSLEIKVLPPFYRTSYAYGSYFFLIVLILHFSRRNIIRRQRRNFLLEQEKREADNLHKMDLMKIRFFTNISHEFKTPLSLILAPIEKLKMREINNESREQLDIINRNAKRLYALINEILDLGNIQNTRLLSTSRGNVIEFVEQIVDSFRILYENKSITLNHKKENSDFYTSYDMDKLDKILFNLLSNAFKFTPEYGQVSVFTRVIDNPSSPNKKTLQIKIKDTGIGISPEDQLMIFDRFFKVDQPEDSNKSGSGIGLSLVKEYVDLYGGEINVESKIGEGSIFTLRIPLEDLHCPKAPQDEDKINKAASLKIQGSPEINEVPTLLIIEDDQDFLSYLTNSFRGIFKVFVASNGREGWKKALAVQPDLIVSDWSMPLMDGTELCEKIRNDSRTRHIPFVLLTANGDEESILSGLKSGVSDYIVKPFNFEVLLSRLQNLINQRKNFQQAYRKKIEVETKQLNIESEDDIFMRKVIKIIEKNIPNTEFSVEKLAMELGVSRTLLYNKIVVRLEKSPHELIRDMRLSMGKELLLKSQLTISEIAFKVGYNNPKYFTKNFKKKFDFLPSEIRSQEPVIS